MFAENLLCARKGSSGKEHGSRTRGAAGTVADRQQAREVPMQHVISESDTRGPRQSSEGRGRGAELHSSALCVILPKKSRASCQVGIKHGVLV